MPGAGSPIRCMGRAIRNSAPVVSFLRTLPSAGGMVLRYHSVNDDPAWRREYIQSSLVVHPEVFDRQIAYLASVYEIVPLDAIVNCVREGRRPPMRWTAITFDDGYEDNARLATPILAKHGATATFYITSGAVGDEELMWTVRLRRAIMRCGRDTIELPFLDSRSVDLRTDRTRERAIKMLTGILKRSTRDELRSFMQQIVEACGGGVPPDRPVMMSWDQIRQVRDAGMTIGGHTVHHYNLPCQSDEIVRSEIEASKRALEDALGEEVRHFAYPNGRTSRHFDIRSARAAARAGYRSAVTSLNGPASPLHSPYCIPRLGIVPRDAALGRLAADIEYGRRLRLDHPCANRISAAGDLMETDDTGGPRDRGVRG
ncbi:MAG: polysaccharide deacetylase family protein [Candidatus Eisenbacteria bacterium]|nr:polysaccharide deacetylase family protein [Candidatus Eisenbacteria bacterium]